MSVKNSVTVRIGAQGGKKTDGIHSKMIDYTYYAVMPVKFAKLLDERLDECYLSLRHMKRKEFRPMTPVELTFNNVIHYGSDEVTNLNDRETHDRICYFVANDRAVQSPVGSGLWNHDLYLIEITKYLEMFVMDSLTFRNSLGVNYYPDGIPGEFTYSHPSTNIFPENDDKEMSVEKSPYPSHLTDIYVYLDNPIVFPSLSELYKKGFLGDPEDNKEAFEEYYYTLDGVSRSYEYIVYLLGPDNTILTCSQSQSKTDQLKYTFENSGIYKIVYRTRSIHNGQHATTDNYQFTASYTFACPAIMHPLKRLTCTDVIKRLCDLAEPLVLGEEPRFKLNSDQAELFDKIYAPEFSMTKQTLRECLKEVGQILHGEPRLRQVARDNFEQFEIYYDLYGGMKESNLRKYADIFSQSVAQIEQYCTHIDSSAQNLINQTDWAAGVITEPSRTEFRTVRTETQYARISDENMLISTDRPIYKIMKLEALAFCKCDNDDTKSGYKLLDITPYIFESTLYNSQLSSYNEKWPYSKAFGIYFTQGEKNIKGLNFKPDRALFPAFAKYAIVNILEQAVNDQLNKVILIAPPWDLNAVENYKYRLIIGDKERPYTELAFRVTYIPFFDVRVAQTKSYYKDHDKALALVYNQTANMIESRNYGESMKGVVARLGNPELSVTYILSRWSQIPQAGELYNDDYYISAVSVEYLPDMIKCTVGLSKDFNRISEYVGVSSEKRYYEVSEKQTYDRSTLYHEYIVIGNEEEGDSDTQFIHDDFMEAIMDTFSQIKWESNRPYSPINCVIAWGETVINSSSSINYKLMPLPHVQLPVVSTAFGNSVAFIWSYQDNYSAGAISQYMENNGVSGYWQNDFPYTDYYGHMYYYNFYLFTKSEKKVTDSPQGDIEIEKGKRLPGNDNTDFEYSEIYTSNPILYRKDSAEIPQFNVQIEFVTNRRDLIIGSALASCNPLVRGTDTGLKAELYVYDRPINKFTTRISAAPDMVGAKHGEAQTVDIHNVNSRFYLDAAAFENKHLASNGEGFEGKSWAIITHESKTLQTVEDETGKITTQEIIKGGEILLACNTTVKVGDTIGEIYFTPRRKLFN